MRTQPMVSNDIHDRFHYGLQCAFNLPPEPFKEKSDAVRTRYGHDRRAEQLAIGKAYRRTAVA